MKRRGLVFLTPRAVLSNSTLSYLHTNIMPTPREDAASLDAATKDLLKAAGQHKAAGWREEFNATKTGSVASGAGGTTPATTDNNPTASNKSAAGSAATRQATSTFRPPSTDNLKL